MGITNDTNFRCDVLQQMSQLSTQLNFNNSMLKKNMKNFL